MFSISASNLVLFVLYWNNEIYYCNNGSFTSEMSKTDRISLTGIFPVSRLDLLQFAMATGPLATWSLLSVANRCFTNLS